MYIKIVLFIIIIIAVCEFFIFTINTIIKRNKKFQYKFIESEIILNKGMHYIFYIAALKFIPLSFAFLALIIVTMWSFYGLIFLIDITGVNNFGDAYGAINTLFSGFAFIGVIIAILLQSQELKEQRNELELTRKTLQGQKIELEIQNETNNRQRFEHTFFNMLSTHRDIANKIVYKNNSGKCIFEILFNKEKQNSQLLQLPYSIDNSNHVSITGKETEDEIKKYYSERIWHITSTVKSFPGINTFDSYFRYLYRILKILDDTNFVMDIERDKDIKASYAGILRAQLSPFELVAIFYNGVVEDYDKMKKFINVYRMLDNLRLELLPSLRDIMLYEYDTFDKEQLIKIQQIRFTHGALNEYFECWKQKRFFILHDKNTHKSEVVISYNTAT